MKKTALAFAVLSAIAGVASAQSSVTLSGVTDASVRHRGAGNGYDWSMGGSQSFYDSLTFSGRLQAPGNSLYGFFGVNLRYTMQGGAINGTTNAGGTNPLFRTTEIGLGGGFGDIRMGRITMPLQAIAGTFDALKTGTVGSTYSGGLNATIRANSAVAYRSPDMGGVSVWAASADTQGQTLDEVGSPTFLYGGRTALLNTKRPVSGIVRYNMGGLRLAAGYDKNTAGMKTTGLYAAYNFGFMEIMGQAEKGDSFTSLTSAAAAPDEKLKDVSVSAVVPVGAARIMFGALQIKSDLANKGAKKVGGGVEYDLFKGFTVYSDIGKMSGNRLSAAATKAQVDLGMRLFF